MNSGAVETPRGCIFTDCGRTRYACRDGRLIIFLNGVHRDPADVIVPLEELSESCLLKDRVQHLLVYLVAVLSLVLVRVVVRGTNFLREALKVRNHTGAHTHEHASQTLVLACLRICDHS